MRANVGAMAVLVLLAPRVVHAQIRAAPGVVIEGKVAVRVHVTLRDDETPYYPVSNLELRFFRDAKDSVRVTTDAAGTVTVLLAPGEYRLGAVTVRLDENGRVAVSGQPNLAGSALSMDRAVAHTVRFAGVTIEDALAMASTTPAEYLGVRPAGSLELEWDTAAFTLRVARVNG